MLGVRWVIRIAMFDYRLWDGDDEEEEDDEDYFLGIGMGYCL